MERLKILVEDRDKYEFSRHEKDVIDDLSELSQRQLNDYFIRVIDTLMWRRRLMREAQYV